MIKIPRIPLQKAFYLGGTAVDTLNWRRFTHYEDGHNTPIGASHTVQCVSYHPIWLVAHGSRHVIELQ